jgi:hypothetical protein
MKRAMFVIFIIIILCSCAKEETSLEFRFTDYYEYMIDNSENIESVTMVTITEMGKLCYDVTSYKDKLYDNIINTKIIDKTDVVVTDDDLMYIFNFNDGEMVSYTYNGTYLVYKNENYEIDNYLLLNLTDVKDLEIKCE